MPYRRFGYRTVPFVVLLGCLLLTALSWRLTARAFRAKAHARFEREAAVVLADTANIDLRGRAKGGAAGADVHVGRCRCHVHDAAKVTVLDRSGIHGRDSQWSVLEILGAELRRHHDFTRRFGRGGRIGSALLFGGFLGRSRWRPADKSDRREAGICQNMRAPRTRAEIAKH